METTPLVPSTDEMTLTAPVVPQLNFWQRPWVQDLLPLIASLAIHLGIVIIALLIGGAVSQMTKSVVQEQIVVPDASFTDGTVGGVPNPGLGDDPNRAAAQDQVKDVSVSSEGWAEKPSQTLTQDLVGGGSGESASEMSVIGLGANTGAGKGSGVAQGSGLGTGTGDGGGPLAVFGMPGGGAGAGPKFMGQGTGGNTRSIAFVCDASGSMMDKISVLREEMKRTIDQLRPIQAFSIVFFSDEKPQALSENLVMASPDNKRKAYDFLQHVVTAGSTHPIPGLQLAFRQHPQLIFLLTDGEFEDNEAVVKAIHDLNPDHAVKINTIAFINNAALQDGSGQEWMDVLRRIAHDNKGTFKQVSPDDIR